MNVRCVEGGCYRIMMPDARTRGCQPSMSSLTHAMLDEYPPCRHVCGGTEEVGHVRVDPDEGDLEPHGCRVFKGLDREGISLFARRARVIFSTPPTGLGCFGRIHLCQLCHSAVIPYVVMLASKGEISVLSGSSVCLPTYRQTFAWAPPIGPLAVF